MNKKKSATEDDKHNRPAAAGKSEVPAMVTEIVDDDEEEQVEEPVTSVPVESKNVEPESKTVQHESKSEVKKYQPEPESEPEPVTPVRQSSEPEDQAEKSKEVVQELFSQKHPTGVTEISIQPVKSTKTLFWWAVVVIVAALTTGLALIFVSSNKSIAPVFAPEPTPTMTPAPTPTPEPVPARSDIKIKVLNGGGVAGAATKMKDFLTEKGYDVVDVGNADEYNYEQTDISVKPDQAGVLDLLKKDLSGTYTVGSTDTSVSADAAYDAVVTVGKE